MPPSHHRSRVRLYTYSNPAVDGVEVPTYTFREQVWGSVRQESVGQKEVAEQRTFRVRTTVQVSRFVVVNADDGIKVDGTWYEMRGGPYNPSPMALDQTMTVELVGEETFADDFVVVEA